MQIPKRTYYKILKIVKDQEFIIRLQERYIDLIDKYGLYYFNLCIKMMKDYSELIKINEHNANTAEYNANQYYEVVRAYNGLASLGKMAQQMGVDIEKHQKELPENKYKDWEFSQKQTLLESGKVKHEFIMQKPKNKKGKRKGKRK